MAELSAKYFLDPLTGKHYSDRAGTREIFGPEIAARDEGFFGQAMQAAGAATSRMGSQFVAGAGAPMAAELAGLGYTPERAAANIAQTSGDLETMGMAAPGATVAGTMLPHMAAGFAAGGPIRAVTTGSGLVAKALGLVGENIAASGISALDRPEGTDYAPAFATDLAFGGSLDMAGRVFTRLSAAIGRGSRGKLPGIDDLIEPGAESRGMIGSQARELAETGGTLTPGGATGSRAAKGIEARMDSLPFSGKVIDDVSEANTANTVNLALRAMGATDDEIAAAGGRMLPPVMDRVKRGMEMDYEDLFTSSPENPVKQILVGGKTLRGVIGMLNNPRSSLAEALKVVHNVDVKRMLTGAERMNHIRLKPNEWRAIQMEAKDMMLNAETANDMDLATLLHDGLYKAMNDSNPGIIGELKELDGRWTVLKSMEGAMDAAGKLTRKTTFNRLGKAFPNQVNYGRFDERHTPEVQEFLKNARAVAATEVPWGNSGTSQRQMGLLDMAMDVPASMIYKGYMYSGRPTIADTLTGRTAGAAGRDVEQ